MKKNEQGGICCRAMVEATKGSYIELPWIDEHYDKPTFVLGGGEFRFCPYCGEDLFLYYDPPGQCPEGVPHA